MLHFSPILQFERMWLKCQIFDPSPIVTLLSTMAVGWMLDPGCWILDACWFVSSGARAWSRSTHSINSGSGSSAGSKTRASEPQRTDASKINTTRKSEWLLRVDPSDSVSSRLYGTKTLLQLSLPMCFQKPFQFSMNLVLILRLNPQQNHTRHFKVSKKCQGPKSLVTRNQ
jgi:hypothetical protein